MEQQNDTKFCSLVMKPTTPDICTSLWLQNDYCNSNIVVKFVFKHYREIHHFCEDDISPHPEDHNIISKELDEESTFREIFVFPLKPETVEYYVECAEMGEYWPDIVTPSIWKTFKDKLSQYLLHNADFGLPLGFEMVAELEVSTLDIPCS